MTAHAAVPVLLAAPGLPGEPELVAACGRRGVGLAVIRRCVDAPDLLAAAAARTAAAAVLGPGLPRLSADTLARLAVHDVPAIGIVAVGDENADRALRRLGITRVVAVPTDDPAAAATALATAVGDARVAPPGPGSYGDVRAAVARAAVRDDAGPPRPAGPTLDAGGSPGHAGGPGRLVAVWGPTGAPGRTTVAVAIADETARGGTPCLLVDADTYGPAVATALGALEEASGIAVACRLADAGHLDVAALAGAARTVSPGLRLLSGLSHPARWPELRPGALLRLWQVCRALAPVTVVDTGFALEQDEELVYDTVAPRRNAATLTALEAADAIVAVGTADPVGIGRLVAALPDLRAIARDTPVRVVVTRVRPGPLGRDPAGQVRAALARLADVDDPVLVPDDRGALDACTRRGRTLAEQAARSPARAALAGLAGLLVASR